VENAGLENAGPSYGAGKRETSCYGMPKQQKDQTFIVQFGAKYETTSYVNRYQTCNVEGKLNQQSEQKAASK